MPVWIQDNNAPAEIGKIWVQENNGPAQIGKVWVQESDGPKLIYQDKEYLVGSEGNNIAQYSNSNNSWSYETSWSKYIFKVTNIKSFNATGWSRIYFDAQMCWYAYPNPEDSAKKVHAMGLFGLKSSNSTSNISVTSSSDLSNLGNAYLTGWRWAGKRGNEWNWDNSDGKINNGGQDSNPSARDTFSLDIRSLTGTQYLYFGGSVNGGGIYNRVKIYNIWLE